MHLIAAWTEGMLPRQLQRVASGRAGERDGRRRQRPYNQAFW